MHFRDQYFDRCDEFAPFGIGYPYKISGDTLIYIIPNEERDIIKRKFEFHGTDTLKLLSGYVEKYPILTLVRMKETIIIPDSMLNEEIADEYEDEFFRRSKNSFCEGW